MVRKVQTLDDVATVKIIPEDYGSALETIVSKIKAAQLRAIRMVNFELVAVYKDIGQIIHEKQSKAAWGASVVERLAKDLKNQFPAVKGFSSRNLWRMKDFYLSYCEKEKLTALLAEISWTHHVYILERCKDPLEREFYIRKTEWLELSYAFKPD